VKYRYTKHNIYYNILADNQITLDGHLSYIASEHATYKDMRDDGKYFYMYTRSGHATPGAAVVHLLME
jgi:hypothetical protein